MVSGIGNKWRILEDSTSQNRMQLHQYEQFSFKVTDWCYRGEGNANVVLSLPKTQQILRIRKTEIPKTFLEKLYNWIIQFFQWNDWRQMENEARDVKFYSLIMAPLMGTSFVQQAKSVYICRADIRKLNKQLKSVRPTHRQNKKLEYGRATLFVDYAFLPTDWKNLNLRGSVYAVEIKPKQGWLSYEDKQYAKCPFCLNQYLKLKNKQIQSLSEYCPVDLFSGEKNRMVKAIKSLLKSPQNNLKIFKDGNYVYGEGYPIENLNKILMEWFADPNILSCEKEFCWLIQKVLTKTVQNDSHNHCHENLGNNERYTDRSSPSFKVNEELAELLRNSDTDSKCVFSDSILPTMCVLERILNFQKLDLLGLSRVYFLYDSWIRKEENRNVDNYSYVDKLLKKLECDIENKCILCVFESSNDADDRKKEEEVEMMLARYLLGAVVRDCSIMMSFQQIRRLSSSSAANVTVVRSENGTDFAVNIGVFDLYPKPLRAIEKHEKRNWEIHTACLDRIVS